MTICKTSFATVGTALALAIAGCGGGSGGFKGDYQQQRATLNKLGSDIANALQSANGKTDSQIEAEFNDLARRAGQDLGKLRSLKPENKYRSNFALVTTGLAKIQQDLAGLARSAHAHSASTAKATTETLVSDATTLKSAAEQLKSDLGIR
ncbi:MAG: hypothetical protein NVSMB51_08490 [Solirubrobacteraceae bacterium]